MLFDLHNSTIHTRLNIQYIIHPYTHAFNVIIVSIYFIYYNIIHAFQSAVYYYVIVN